MSRPGNPYQSLPARSFWRTAVAEPEMLAIDDLWTPKFVLSQDDPILTAWSRSEDGGRRRRDLKQDC